LNRFSGQVGPFFDNSADFKAMLGAFSCFWASGIGHTPLVAVIQKPCCAA
jgi:hypothetical protein